MSERARHPWPTYLLGIVCVAALASAYATVGPASQTVAQSRIVTARRGVVLSTVSGSGNIQAANQLELGFKTSGVVTHVYMHQGEYVTEGRLLAELDPQAAEVTLEQARASLQAAQVSLAQQEETGGEPSTHGSSGDRTTATTETSPKIAGASEGPSRSNTRTEPSSPAAGSTQASTGSPTGSTVSQATRDADIASARAAVKSDRLTVQSDEQAVANTKLYAPQTGTIVSLGGEVGETVTARGTTKASASMGSAAGSGSGSSANGADDSSSGGTSSGASTNTGSSNSSSSAFAVLSDLSSMQLVVALSESEIGSVRAGQPATVTIEALEGRKLAAHVVSVATLPTSSSGVVSYDVTFQLDQEADGLKPGMSATAEVIVKRAEGITVPSSAISADTVTVVRAGKRMRVGVVAGLTGTSSTIVLNGLSVGEEVVLPSARTASPTSGQARFGGRPGAGGSGFANGAAGLGGGGGVFFRGGG